ncbi:hypothetical protein Tco_1078361 [Tanacetum coccineum]|uniref:Uncharacterized protein n=1 Tax=Tanacetum coccineum TaxID=301880 RepID=A0ABQ5HPY1_9ASTR
MQEPEKLPKNPIKAHIQRDVEIAQRLFEEEQAQFEREQRIARERVVEQEAKDAVLIKQMEYIQPRMDAYELLAERLQQEEREQFTIEEKSRMLVEMIPEMKRSRSMTFGSYRNSEVVKDSKMVKLKGFRKKTVTRKRIGKKLDDESVKRQKIEDDAEKEELRAHLGYNSKEMMKYKC